MTHTPGKWKADGCTVYSGEIILAATYCEGNRELHSLDEKDTLPDSDDGQLGHGWKEALKNARLIAAAPELLATLRGLMNQAAKDAEGYAKDGSAPIWAWIADASDIIAKADGNA